MDDVIDLLVGIEPGSRLDAVRAQRLQARENAQRSFTTLFQPEDPGSFSVSDRHAVAMFVAGLHRQADITEFYAGPLEPYLKDLVQAEIDAGLTEGPYGHYPAGALTSENVFGLIYEPAEPTPLTPTLAAALAHAHRLVFHPRDAEPEWLQALLHAGWTTDGIVTLSQLVAFLCFQIRVVAGLLVLKEAA